MIITILLIIALVFLILSAVPVLPNSPVNLLALGLFFFVLTFLPQLR